MHGHPRRTFTASLLLLVAPGVVSAAVHCWNVNGECDTACPGAWSCLADADCGPGGTCYQDETICMSGGCTCVLLVPGEWYWSCQTICTGFCLNELADTDRDGLPDLNDNCPAIWNPGQRDCDADQIGDACDACSCNLTPAQDPDGDSRCSLLDNCPFVANPSQANADGDSDGDACDCAPGDPALHRPREIADVRVDRLPAGSRFHWSATPPAERYEIRGGLLSNASPELCWTVYDSEPHDTEYVELDDPLVNEGWCYIFRGVSGVCGEGAWDATGYEPSCP